MPTQGGAGQLNRDESIACAILEERSSGDALLVQARSPPLYEQLP